MNKELTEKNSAAVMTYKNLIILVQYSSTKEVDIGVMNDVMIELEKILRKF
ncbi:hypothetical protein TKV_c08120 [Thermoanaerobacter kivui]|uniref:Uncharacterized protein n=1 Tax=Thermoanaerobacter kivui TaxID=2325 RepID=A0A097AQ84_THEKI|nr:hypothetical protein [Thermoanaerobacter kivui]AIS51994.1 hypothetical protein TKV_c08120 [Thermoanaerobacter kivui]